MSGEVFLTAQQVAARYGLTAQWAYHCPELQAIRRKIGKKTVRWALSDIEEFEKLDRDKVTGGKPADLVWMKERQETQKREQAEKKFKFDLA